MPWFPSFYVKEERPWRLARHFKVFVSPQAVAGAVVPNPQDDSRGIVASALVPIDFSIVGCLLSLAFLPFAWLFGLWLERRRELAEIPYTGLEPESDHFLKRGRHNFQVDTSLIERVVFFPRFALLSFAPRWQMQLRLRDGARRQFMLVGERDASNVMSMLREADIPVETRDDAS